MRWSQNRSTAVAALLALLVGVGFAAAPVAAIDGTDATGTETDEADADAGDEFPEEVCTDITGMVNDEIPYDQVIWVDDLPEDAQPDNVPWNLVTPRTAGAIITGVIPNQCEVVDPNDPPYDPREDDVDPDGGADVNEETDEGTTLIILNGTLNRSADGPGGETTVEFAPAANGMIDAEVRINDGEKDYVVDPGVRYWDDGTVYLENDVVVIGKRAGVEYDCNGEECEVDLRGAPKLVDYPAVPSHSAEDHTSDEQETGGGDDGDADDGTGSDVDETDETSTTSGADDVDPDDSDGAAGDGSAGASDGDEGSGDGADDGSDDEAADSTDDGDEGPGENGTDESDGADDGSDGPENQPAQAAAQGDGPGFGAGVAVLSVLVATLTAHRRFS